MLLRFSITLSLALLAAPPARAQHATTMTVTQATEPAAPAMLVVHTPVEPPPALSDDRPSSSPAPALADAPAAQPAGEPPLPPAEAAAPHQLSAVRVRSEGDTLRVILQFDSPPPYTIRRDPGASVATLELINTRIAYLPPEVARLDDPRLSGIWIRRLDPAMATLELRLPSDAVRIEHFSLPSPPAIVIDFKRTDSQVAPVGGTQIAATLPTVSRPAAALVRTNGAVVPQSWLNPGQPAAASESTSPSASPDEASPSPEETPALVVQRLPDPDEGELGPRAEDFEGFPIETIHVESALAREMLEDFISHRWGMVVQKGVNYLGNNPITAESVDVLYLVAEARWQLGKLETDPPYEEMRNFYDQAMRLHDGGPLGAFGHLRLAQASDAREEPSLALFHINAALPDASPAAQIELLLLKARELAATSKVPEALSLLQSLGERQLSTDQRVALLKLEGNIKLDHDDAEGAWQAFAEATRLDPGWTNLDYAGWENRAIAGSRTGHAKEALADVQSLLRNYSNRDKSENYRLLLLHAQLLEQLGDTDVAEQTYATVLKAFGESVAGADIQSTTRRRFPREVLDSEGRYCMLLWKQGKITQAMAELHRAHEACLRDGVDPHPLAPIVQVVLPDFMNDALARDTPFDVVEAWRLFNYLLETPGQRERCLDPLEEAMERLGLYDEALALLRRKPAERPDTALRLARLLVRSQKPAEALKVLERPLPGRPSAAQRAEAAQLLAASYRALNQPLQAAQAWQEVAGSPSIDPADRGAAAVDAGLLFLQNKMPLQTIELGIKCLMMESDAQKNERRVWPRPTSAQIRLLLARAYAMRGDDARAEILLKDFSAMAADHSDDVAPEDLAIGRLLAARAQRKLGRPGDAIATLDLMLKDKTTPAPYAAQATGLRKVLVWDQDHPDWSVLRPKNAASQEATAATP